MDTSAQRNQLTDAHNTRQKRAAMGYLVRRNVEEFTTMTPDERRAWIEEVGLLPSFYSEIMKEIALCKYTEERQ